MESGRGGLWKSHNLGTVVKPILFQSVCWLMGYYPQCADDEMGSDGHKERLLEVTHLWRRKQRFCFVWKFTLASL